jgi:hypothetical protein
MAIRTSGGEPVAHVSGDGLDVPEASARSVTRGTAERLRSPVSPR